MTDNSHMKARPTMYKGTLMRSRTEAGFATWLDSCGFSWEYEPCAFASADGQYLPDFRINAVHCSWVDGPATVYVEVKPASWPNGDDGAAGVRARIGKLFGAFGTIAESEPAAQFVLARPDSDPILWRTNDTTVSGLTWFGRAPDLPPELGLMVSKPWPDGYWEQSSPAR